jgi:MFS transporter, YNFM family, putative membrane transport protein
VATEITGSEVSETEQRNSAPSVHRTLAVVLAGFCAFLPLYATQPLLPLLQHIFHANKVAVSMTLTAATIGVALAAPLIGRIADRFGRKRVIVCSAALLALSTLLAATASTLPLLISWRFLQGVFTPGVFAVTVAYIQEEWAGFGIAAAMAAYVAGTVLGGFTGRIASGVIASHVSWHWVFTILGVVAVAGTFVLYAWLPPERSFVKRHPASLLQAAGDHLRNRQLLAVYAAGFCVLFSLIGTFTYVTFYLTEAPFHLSPAALGSLFFVYLIGAIVTPACGHAIDRLGYRSSLAFAMTFSIAGVLLTLVHHLGVVTAGLAICCSGVFVSQTAATSYIGVAAERNKALAVGLYVTFYYAGGSLGAALPGYLWPIGGWPACVALLVLVQLATIGIVLAWWVDPPKPGKFELATVGDDI